MELIVRRMSDNGVQTLSVAQIMNGIVPVYSFHVLELPWKENQKSISCIPAGDYWVVKRKPGENGSRFNYDHFEILNVPGRSFIKIHIANYVTQLAGCMAPGEFAKYDMNGDGQIDVSNSTSALKKMVELLPSKFKMRIYPYREFVP